MLFCEILQACESILAANLAARAHYLAAREALSGEGLTVRCGCGVHLRGPDRPIGHPHTSHGLCDACLEGLYAELDGLTCPA